MKKLLRTRDILLLGLAGALEVIQEIRDPFDTISGGYKFLYGYVPRKYKKENYRHMLWRSLRTGYIEKIVKNDKVYLRLTSKGKDRIKRDFPLLLMQSKKWDGRWRVVIFDIAEEKKYRRDKLRMKLNELGFGMLQKSVWITPHDFIADFKEFVNLQGLSKYVFALEAKHLLAGDEKQLAVKIWKLKAINNSYSKLLKEIKHIKKKISRLTKYSDRGKMLNVSMERDIKNIRKKYFDLIVSDPHLPKELLPNDWLGKSTEKEVKELEYIIR